MENLIEYKPNSPTRRFADSLIRRFKDWGVIVLFVLLTLIMLFPLSLNLSNMVAEPTDPLLNSWRMQWNAHAFLSGADGINNLFDTNIFYPFPLTLAYSEHFLMITAQALPFLLLADSHLFGMNISVLFSFVLSGYAMYLLATDWSGSRLAGLAAGILFAFSPHRFGQLNHLELLITQWMPLTLLALHWTLTRPGLRYPVLFAIFFNLQALSGFHFSLSLTIACILLAVVYSLSGRVHWRRGLWVAAGLSIVATLLVNWPVWRVYLHFSDIMGAVRTPGEVRIYSAALTDYLTTIPYNWLYGWTFGRWQPENHQFQPLMPFGLVGLILAVVGLFWPKKRNYTLSVIIFLALLAFISLFLSFGLNDNALGSSLSPLLKLSPYFWLYDNVAVFQGIRVPGRFGILAVVGLTLLAGYGLSRLLAIIPKTGHKQLVTAGVSLFILIESWSVPLRGPEFLAGQNIPPVYNWLQKESAADVVIVELPFQGASEFKYEYYSSYHWRRMANGGTGFTPPIYKELRQWFNSFPDARSVDIIQQMGIDLVILHPASYKPADWQRVMADLPLYLPAITQIKQVGEALVLRMAASKCKANPDTVYASISSAELDGLPDAVKLTYTNNGLAAFTTDVRQVSRLIFTDGTEKNFTEPMVIPAGESQSVIIPLRGRQLATDLYQANLATLRRTISADEPQNRQPFPQPEADQWQPLGLSFSGGGRLEAYQLTPNPTPCGTLTAALKWQDGQAGDTAVVQIVDPYGRVIIEDTATNEQPNSDLRLFSLTDLLPPGRYGLRVRLFDADNQERQPVTDEGVTIPPDRIPPLPLIIRPQRYTLNEGDNGELPIFGEIIQLAESRIYQQQVTAGDWLRFRLVWQTTQPVEQELTVFTQLIGADGQVWGQRDNLPLGGWYSTPLWLPNRPVADDYAFQIREDAPPGTYRLIAGWYNSDSLERIHLQNGADFVEIGTVQVNK